MSGVTSSCRVDVFSAVEPLERRVLLSGGGIYNEGILTITGTTLGNAIHVSYTHEGVAVRVDGQEQLFREPVHTIAVNAGHGDNVVQYRQFVAAGIALGIVTGDGQDDIDIAFELVDPSRTPSEIPTFAVDVDAGGGADRVKVQFSWLSDDEAGLQFDLLADIRPGGEARFTPEIGDEVVVAMEYGDPDQPIIVGAVYNAGGAAAAPQQPRLGLRNLARDLSATTEFHLTGSEGNDVFDVNVNYSGVRLQQGRVLVDADFNEGVNRFDGQYIVGSARHMIVSSTITAGDGNNEISLVGHELAHAVQQRAGITDGTSNTIMVSEVSLGHGNNVIQVNATDYDFVHHLVELGDGDNEFVVAIRGDADVELLLTAGDGDNSVEFQRNGFATHPRQSDGRAKVEVPNLKLTVSLANGDNSILIHDMLGSRGNHTYAIDLGDGDNRTVIRFGDGQHGRRLPTGQSNVTATYRTGGGNNRVEIHGDTRAPVAAEFLLDLGDGQNDVVKRWNFTQGWPSKWESPGVAPSQTKVIIMGNAADVLDMTVRTHPPEEGGGKPLEIVVVGSKVEGTIDFLRLLGVNPSPAGAKDGTIEIKGKKILQNSVLGLNDLTVGERLDVRMDAEQSGIDLAFADVTLKRGVLQMGGDHTITTIGGVDVSSYLLELDGLVVSGSAVVDVQLDSPVIGRTVLSDARVGENSSCWIRVSQGWGGASSSLELHDLQIDGTFTAELQTGGSSASVNASDITLKRGVTHSNSIAVESLKLANEGFVMDFEGLEVFGAFATDVRVGGPGGSRTAFRDVRVHESATFSHDWTDHHDHDPGVAAAGEVVMKGRKILQNSALELDDFTVARQGRVDIAMSAGDAPSLIWFAQRGLLMEADAITTVQLSGREVDGVTLVQIQEVSGNGSYNFLADGGGGSNFIAVLARELDPGDEGSMSFEVRGGDGDDTLAMAVVAPTVRGDAISARIDGGRGFNSCFATSNVLVENCDRELDREDILRLLRRHLARVSHIDLVNSKEYTDEWSTAV